ncbi:hypothetical protein DNTS_029617, partial [Danionella cerebrum]
PKPRTGGASPFLPHMTSLSTSSLSADVRRAFTLNPEITMKASAPVRPHKVSFGCSQVSLRYLEHSKMEEEDLFCLQHGMNHCYSRLKRLVPSIPQDKKVSKVEILQHVIDYILDLQLALETHPALTKQTSPPASTRTPLSQINTEQDDRCAMNSSKAKPSFTGDSNRHTAGLITGEQC